MRWIARLGTVIPVVCIMQSAAARSNDLVVAPDTNRSFYTETHVLVEYNVDKTTRSIYVENDNFVLGDVFVPDGTHLYIRNSGVIDGTIYLGNDAQITQVIKNESDITLMDIDAGFTVLIVGDAALSFMDIMRVGMYADRVVLDNASVVLGNIGAPIARFRRRDPQIQLVGEVTVYLDDVMSMNGALLFSNVDGDGNVSVATGPLHPMYAAETYRVSGNIYLRVVRETDYRKFLDPDVGLFINEFRATYPDDKMVVAFDNAADMNALYNLMDDCARINPLVLMRPVRTLAMMNMDGVDVPNGDTLAVTARPFYVITDDATVRGADLSVRFGRDETYAVAGLHVGTLEYSDYLNDFGGIVFGANLRVHSDLDDYFVDVAAGIGGGAFDIEHVWTGDTATDNPIGITAFGRVDTGVRFKVTDAISVAPFVGMGGIGTWILSSDAGDVYGRAGTDVTVKYEMDGLRYDYALRVVGDTSGGVTAGLRMGAWSVWDDAGGDIEFMVRRDDVATSYRIGISARVGF